MLLPTAPDRLCAPARVTSTRALILRVALLLGFASAAHATDGILEINQTCAVQTGCFVGDPPGFPVVIDDTVPGKSFRLTSDLVVPAALDGITIGADFVEIDLNGFRMVSDQCESATSMCNEYSAASYGITSLADTNDATVRNGSVVGMNATGIDLNQRSRVENVSVKWSGAGGIRVGEHSTVVDNYVFENGLYSGTAAPRGIRVDAGSIVRGNKVVGNASSGIRAYGVGCLISGNVVVGNGLWGIVSFRAAEIAGNLVVDNFSNGIFANDRSTISGNAAIENGGVGISAYSGSSIFDNVVFKNGDHGIAAEPGISIQRNSVRANEGRGLSVFSGVAYRENRITINDGGNVVGPGLNMGDNACDNATTCP